MSIALDVKDAIIEAGVATTILRDSGNVTGNYIKYDLNAQVTKPFIREHFIELMLPSDYPAEVGEIIQVDVSGIKYMLMSTTPNMFENSVSYYSAVMYKTNVVVDVKRPSEDDWPTQTYHKVTEWTTVAADVNALLSDPLFGTDLETDQQIAFYDVFVGELYIASSVGIEVNDRIRIVSDEYYKVETVLRNRFNGVDVCKVVEDSRPACTTTTTTTTTSSSTTTTTAP